MAYNELDMALNSYQIQEMNIKIYMYIPRSF